MHIHKKIEQLNKKYRKMWLIAKKSQLTIYNELLIYKSIFKSIWTPVNYGTQLRIQT